MAPEHLPSCHPRRAGGYSEVAILFTDLVEFSRWALEAGDTAAVALLRLVGEATEPPIEANGGKIVKRLGDGLMAVFDEPQGAVAARVADAAGPNEVLVSETARELLDTGKMKLKRRWTFRAKGAPDDLKVYAVRST